MQVQENKRLATLTLAALGIVYGDIGTSPLYSIKEVFGGAHHPVPINPDNVLGILSLFFWSLVLIVTVKYVMLVMRADNRGEGGILALMALVHPGERDLGRSRRILVGLGLFALQRRGTAGIGAIFGPVMLLWFAVLATLGVRGIVGDPSVLAALLPR